MPDGFVSATEANKSFSRLLKQVEDGGQVTITKDGKPVAVLVPVDAAAAIGQEAARRRMLALLQEGLPIGYAGPLDRDAIHAR